MSHICKASYLNNNKHSVRGAASKFVLLSFKKYGIEAERFLPTPPLIIVQPLCSPDHYIKCN